MIPLFLRGDFRYFWAENIGDFAHLPSAWDASLNTGIGKSTLGSLWINSYLNFTATFTRLGLSWNAIGLIFWILPSTILSFFSAYYLFKTSFPDSKRFGFLAGLVYLFNTYFLMILTGGQLGVALSYSLAPLVLLTFIRIIKNPTLRSSFVSGLILGLQILFDPRIVYITIFAFLVYLAFNLPVFIKVIKSSLLLFITPFIIGILLHSYWMLPLALTKSSPIPLGFNSVEGFEFFSFADFSHSFSLLHPNWPENIFGKIYFLQSEFLLLPILAYASLLFINSKLKTQILYFSFLGLIGTFLTKGANEPFGEINRWLFQYFPGMNMFRDPTKWYILVAVSYSMLISYSISRIYEWLKQHPKFSFFNFQFSIKSKIFNLQNFFLLLASCFLLFLVRPLWMSGGELREKLKPREVPQEYVELKDFLHNQPQFFRTLWLPEWQRFGYFSNNHPAIGRYEILKSASASGQIKELARPSSKELLKDLAVKYIIVPYDSEGEIFLEDRKYDSEKRARVEGELDKIPWLTKVRFGRIAVYEIKGNKDRFWSPADLGISYSFISPTGYKVTVKNAQKGDLLIFSESFDKNWIAKGSDFRLKTSDLRNRLNSFVIPKEGNYEFKVFYNSQKWVNIGLVISVVTVLIAVLGLLRLKKMTDR